MKFGAINGILFRNSPLPIIDRRFESRTIVVESHGSADFGQDKKQKFFKVPPNTRRNRFRI